MAYLTLAQFKAFYSIPHVRFTGSGLNDLTVSGIDANTSSGSYVVKVDGTGATDTFRWSHDNGATWEATCVNMSTSGVALENGIVVTWAAKTGHTTDDYWSFAVDNLRRDAIMQTCITDAQAYIESAEGCNRVFEWTGDGTAWYFDRTSPRPVYGRRLYFNRDAYEITSITNGNGAAVSASSYVTLPRNVAPYHGVELLQSSGLSWTYTTTPEKAITVVAKWAYSASPPAAIVQATRLVAKHFFDLRESKLQLGAVDAGAFPLGERLPYEARQIMVRYKRRWGCR